jgi:hypothetical protein
MLRQPEIGDQVRVLNGFIRRYLGAEPWTLKGYWDTGRCATGEIVALRHRPRSKKIYRVVVRAHPPNFGEFVIRTANLEEANGDSQSTDREN